VIATTGLQKHDLSEIRRFDALARTWWDPTGPMAPLHKLNPVRLGYIRSRVCHHFALDEQTIRPFAGLRILDVGCGAGLLTEPLARLGACVTGLDPAEEALAVARRRAEEQDLVIDYRAATVEELVGEDGRFDLVSALEVVEHVPDPDAFLQGCVRLVRPDGALVLSTLNRTARAFALGIIGAEYLLGWLPRGTHSWRRFRRPSELARPLRRAGAETVDVTGMVYDPLRDRFALSEDVSVNYLLFATVPTR
jgi:2-polyprenyl-6-hydroxyphenyl methylase/3-demethylubiquinone-9 3-methyltransferase